MTFSTVRGETRVNMSYEEIQKMIYEHVGTSRLRERARAFVHGRAQ